MIFVSDATLAPLVRALLPQHASGLGVDENRGRTEQLRREGVRDERASGEESLRRAPSVSTAFGVDATFGAAT